MAKFSDVHDADDHSGVAALSGPLAHIGDSSDAHDASAISVLDTAANFTGTDVEAVLAELQDNIDGVSGGSGDVATDAIFDAKGDLAVGTGADTAAKLTVGSNGTILTAASGQATGLQWGALPVAAKIIRTANASAGSDYTTTSATMGDVDATNLTINLTTLARRCMVGVTGIGFNTNATGRIDLGVTIDGSLPNGAFINVSQHSETSNNMNISFTFLTDVLSAGSHAFVLQFARGSAGTGTLGASATNPLCFWVAETMIAA